MREIYTAPVIEAAEARFDELAETWAERYPAMIDTWRRAAGEFIPFSAFPVELRRILYTTNAVESLDARFCKAGRHRTHFPIEQAALKVLYLVATEHRADRSNPTGKIRPFTTMNQTVPLGAVQTDIPEHGTAPRPAAESEPDAGSLDCMSSGKASRAGTCAWSRHGRIDARRGRQHVGITGHIGSIIHNG